MTGTIMKRNKCDFSISKTDPTDFESSLNEILQSMPDGSVMIGEASSGGSGVTEGARAIVILYRRNNGVYMAHCLQSLTNGYYYNGAWHWFKSSATAFVPT